ncbi:MAG: T9SS type A sorting domain-containing protein, partial [Pedobacter sp.]
TAQSAPPINVWSHIAVVISGNSVTHYLNGQVNGTGTLTTSGANGSDNMYIGSRSDVVTRFKGRIDEVRVVNGALSADWIKTEYNSQSAPGTFYTISGESAAREGLMARTGSTTITATEIVTQENEQRGVSLYPNPVADEFVLNVSVKEEGIMNIYILDQQGRVQKTVRSAKNSKLTQVRMNVSSLAKGVYMVKLEMKGFKDTIKMIKL